MFRILLSFLLIAIWQIGISSAQDINLIDGKWNLPCFSKVDESEAYHCPIAEVDDFVSFEIDAKTGKGSMEQSMNGFSMTADVVIEQEDDKWFLSLNFASGEVMKGEIMKLDKSELKAKFGAEGGLWRLWRRPE